MPSPSRIVAIAGATGGLGTFVTDAILDERFQSLFKTVVVLARKQTNQITQWEKRGATVRIYRDGSDEALLEALKDVDVFVNTIGNSGYAFKAKLMRLLPQTSVVLYFPSEFGADHYIHDFSHKEWDAKKQHYVEAKEILGKASIKICRVFTGLFLEDSIGPWFGFDVAKGHFEAIGSRDARVSYTSKRDVGFTVAALALMPVGDVPETVHLSGDVGTFESIATTLHEAGGKKMDITEVDLKTFKEATLDHDTKDPSQCLRFLMGEGKIDHEVGALGCDNELVNPQQRKWRWKTLKDLARDTNGDGGWGDWQGSN